MTVLIDPPLWPAHGTVFSHLVSDVSVEELHAFAHAAGIDVRAFDRDHYDVPAREHDRLVTAGALPVTASELTRRLIASDVRIPSRQRPDRHDAWLRQRFESLLPGQQDRAESVLGRWAGPGRHYHDRRHLADVLRGIDRLTEDSANSGGFDDESVRTAHLAAWWHDAVYDGVAGADERASARLAQDDLGPLLPASHLARVSRAIEMTADHRPDDDPAQALLSDADLRVLARPERSYRHYVQDVRRDYAHVEDAAFARGRAQVLRGLLGADRLYVTDLGHALWEATARQNLERELAELS